MLSRRGSAVAELLVVVWWTALGRLVEQVPERLDRAHVARVLAGIGGGVKELGAPEVPDPIAVAVKDVHHGPLVTLSCLGVVVAVVGIAARRNEGEPAPTPLLGEGEDAIDRGFGRDDEVGQYVRVLRRALELVNQGRAGRAG